ncbi:hypothetical protein ACFYTC_43500 [Actinomadura nitritigenes]|uniref:hypothetical protein n=1 Tax=Actinomadura nitritigenes TaxID=134602 RepID=UPI003694F216
MKHRIVVLGAGYAGAYTAGTLARRLSPADTEITVVNAVPDSVQRLRMVTRTDPTSALPLITFPVLFVDPAESAACGDPGALGYSAGHAC